MRCGASCRCTPFVSVCGHHLGKPWSGFALRKPPTTSIQIGKVPRRGIAMIRATVVRALVLAAAFAAALTPVTCLGEDSNLLPTRATKELPPELLSLL